MKLFNKRPLTPEELEEKSRREKEWADKCYRAGERIGRKYSIPQKIKRINEYANRYPRTFFLTLLGIIVVCFVLNWMIVGLSYHPGTDFGNDIRTVTIEPDRSRQILDEEINLLYKEMEGYAKQIDEFTSRDSLTRGDSVRIGQIILRMQELDRLIKGKESGGAPQPQGNPSEAPQPESVTIPSDPSAAGN